MISQRGLKVQPVKEYEEQKERIRQIKSNVPDNLQALSLVMLEQLLQKVKDQNSNQLQILEQQLNRQIEIRKALKLTKVDVNEMTFKQLELQTYGLMLLNDQRLQDITQYAKSQVLDRISSRYEIKIDIANYKNKVAKFFGYSSAHGQYKDRKLDQVDRDEEQNKQLLGPTFNSKEKRD